MFKVNQLIGFGSGRANVNAIPATIKQFGYIASSYAQNDANANYYTFSSWPLGDDETGRHIVVSVAARSTTGVPSTVDSVQIDGNECTIGRQVTDTTEDITVCHAWIEVPDGVGATGEVRVDFGTTLMDYCSIALYKIVTDGAGTLQEGDGANWLAGTYSDTFVTKNFGAIVATHLHENDSDPKSWVGVDEQVDEDVGGQRYSTASRGGLTVSDDYYVSVSDSADDGISCVSSFWFQPDDPISVTLEDFYNKGVTNFALQDTNWVDGGEGQDAVGLVISGGLAPYTCKFTEVSDDTGVNFVIDSNNLPYSFLYSTLPLTVTEATGGGRPQIIKVQVTDANGKVGVAYATWETAGF